MEGFLQSLKFKNPDMQVEVCKLVGFAAKKKGAPKNWKRQGVLWWRGKQINRFGKDYQEFLDRAYNTLLQNTSFQKALLSSGDGKLTHAIGHKNAKDTILTVSEFCSRLMKLRKYLRSK